MEMFWMLVSTENHRDIMRNMFYYLVHLVGRLLRVRSLRDGCVTLTVFTFRVYVETIGIILPGDISYGPHNSLYVIHFTL